MKKYITLLLIFVSLTVYSQKHFIVPFDNTSFAFIDYKQMDSVIEILRDNPSYTIIIIGHAHHREGNNSQFQQINLSINRAELVKRYFLTRNIQPHRITLCRGKGADDPIDRNHPKINWRAEVFIEEKINNNG